MRRTKEEAEQTRLKIIEAALKLFSRNGYSHTTLAMIAREAGFSRGPIYWHFSNKDELYEAVLAYSQDPLQALVRQTLEADSPVDAITGFVDEWFRLLEDDRWYRQSFEILLNKTELTGEMARTIRRERRLTRDIVAMFEKRIAEAQKARQCDQSDSARRLALLAYTYLMGITQSWLFSPRLFSLAREKAFFRARLLRTLGMH